MKADALKGMFVRMGVRLQLEEPSGNQRGRQASSLTLDVRSDAAGEFFDIRLGSLAGGELDVVDLRRRDHKTILLQVWHKVVMNTEGQSKAMRHVVFLD